MDSLKLRLNSIVDGYMDHKIYSIIDNNPIGYDKSGDGIKLFKRGNLNETYG
jgi:hypothetical protein